MHKIMFVPVCLHLLNSHISHAYAQRNDRELFVVLFGETRSGKDCFINTIAGRKIANEGKFGSPESTTKHP